MELIIIWFICGFICSVIAGSKGRSGGWFFLIGLLFGPLGVVLCLVLPKNDLQIEKEWVQSGQMRKCSFCAEIIRAEAIKCKHCQSDVVEKKAKLNPADAEIVSAVVDTKNLNRKIIECSCGESFSYDMYRAGDKIICLGCRGSLVLP